jgi:hypothetical protein
VEALDEIEGGGELIDRAGDEESVQMAAEVGGFDVEEASLLVLVPVLRRIPSGGTG